MPTEERSVVVDTPLRHERLRLSWVTPAWFEAGDAELDFLAWWLWDKLSERFEVDEYSSLGVRQASSREASIFRVTILGEEEVDVVPFLQVIDEELENIRREPITETEFAELRGRYLAWERRGKRRPLSRASSIAWSAGGLRMTSPEENLARYEEVTPASVHRTALEFLRPERRLIVHANYFNYAPAAGTVAVRRVR